MRPPKTSPMRIRPSRPRFVFLDMGNVIVNFDRGRALRNLERLTGRDTETLRHALVAHRLSERLECGALDWEAFHREFSTVTGTRSDPEALATAYSDMFDLAIGMLPVVAGLERFGCRIGILSNTCGVHWNHIVERSFGILPGDFEVIVLSHEVGLMKPDRAIFDHAAARAGVEPEGIFFADDLPRHVAAAREAGWDAEVFSGAERGPIDLARALEARGLDRGL
jgi:FMN phosphatase YigB (HAD superfamily)